MPYLNHNTEIIAVPPAYRCEKCQNVYIPLVKYYPCPVCGKTCTVEQISNIAQKKYRDDLAIVSAINEIEKFWNSQNDPDFEYPNIVLDLVASMRKNKKNFGCFTFWPRCGTGHTLTIESLRRGGSYLQFIHHTTTRFFDFYETHNHKSISTALPEFLKKNNFAEFKYIEKNLTDIITGIYPFYKSDKTLYKRRRFKIFWLDLKRNFEAYIDKTIADRSPVALIFLAILIPVLLIKRGNKLQSK